MEPLKFCLIFITIPFADGAVPGTFFWQPRLGLDLSVPTTEAHLLVALPTKDNVKEGLIMLIDGYQAGMTLVALAAGMADAFPYPHLNPSRGYFYTSAYRWFLRHMSMMPFWLGGNRGSFCNTLQMWKRRFFYMDEVIPKWLRSAIFYVKEEDWIKEIKDLQRYKKYSEFAFAKHYRFPSKQFNNFKSLETEETKEMLDSQSSSYLSSKGVGK